MADTKDYITPQHLACVGGEVKITFRTVVFSQASMRADIRAARPRFQEPATSYLHATWNNSDIERLVYIGKQAEGQTASARTNAHARNDKQNIKPKKKPAGTKRYTYGNRRNVLA